MKLKLWIKDSSQLEQDVLPLKIMKLRSAISVKMRLRDLPIDPVLIERASLTTDDGIEYNIIEIASKFFVDGEFLAISGSRALSDERSP